MAKARASRNRTMTLEKAEIPALRDELVHLEEPVQPETILDRVVCQDLFAAAPLLPRQWVDLLIVDPPYNLSKTFNERSFRKLDPAAYEAFVEAWLTLLLPTLKPTASVYVCAEWSSSTAVHRVIERHLKVRNRITWQREKGRGAKTNWKNASEDIWFCTVGKEYYFDVDAVKSCREVVAPYRQNGKPKDWQETKAGNFRQTHPSNLWTDLTVPFWSMPENTDHPTQKPEKGMARLILASCPSGGTVLDPFAGVGTSGVAAKKLGRHFSLIEADEHYCCLALKRLAAAEEDQSIQGYEQGLFWDRNTLGRRPTL